MDPGFLTDLLVEYTYVIMAPAAMLLGPMVSLVAGVLLRLDVISIIPTIIALAVGELGADIIWYWVGRRYGEPFVRRFGRYFGITETSITYAKGLFDRHHDIIIFASKLTAGFGFAMLILFTAGLSRVPFRRYMMFNIAGQFLWTSAMLSVGFFLSHIYLKVGNTFEKMALLALGIIVFASLIGFARYLRARFLRTS
jgi:membrane-associated protein